ncbi:MAG: hypothetical protein FJ045_04125 [Crenarchaeota archaeon]|nr:hypothetical protein [Thermoproteota archaeon]
MREILKQQNLDLLRELKISKEWIANANIAEEMQTYQKAVSNMCEHLLTRIFLNLKDLDIEVDEVLDDVRSETQTVMDYFGLLNERLIGPIRRFLPSDRICLKILSWLHDAHPQTRSSPLAINDGPVGVWPMKIPVYFMPSSRQQGLLLLPLFFHEFGHVLYCSHQQELDSLIRDFQNEVTELLTPKSVRDDLWTDKERQKRNRIVEIWYNWMVEIFCDAVGLTIGGPSFVNAFSLYFRMRGRCEFHMPEEDLWKSEHPISILRMRLITDRARNQECFAEAEAVEKDWEKIADVLGIREDHYGFLNQDFYAPIHRTVDDMLVEACPRKFSQEDTSEKEWNPASSTPVHLFNNAWSVFSKDPQNYPDWEQRAIKDLLGVKQPSSP